MGGPLILARLPQLTTVRDFDVSAAAGLHLLQLGVADLDAFGALETVTGHLVVRLDSALVDVSGLHGVTSVTEDLRIGGNASLSRDDIETLVRAIGRENVGGEIVIQDEVW